MNNFREAFHHLRSFETNFWLLLAATLMHQIGNMGMIFLMPYLNQHLGYSLFRTSFVFATFSGSMILGGLLSGRLACYRPERLLPIILCCTSGVLFIFPFVKNLAWITLLTIIWGAAFGIYRPTTQTLLAEFSKPGYHKLTFSMYRWVLNLGMSIGPAMGGFIAVYSFKAIYITNAMTNLFAALILLVGFVPTLKTAITPLPARKKLSLNTIYQDKTLMIFLLGLVPISMIFAQHESTLVLFLSHDLNFSLSFYGLLFTLNTLMIVGFEFLINIIMLKWTYRLSFTIGGLFITLGFFCLGFAVTKMQVVLLAMSWTLGEMIFFPAVSSYIADIAPKESRANYMGINSTAANVGMLLGPWGGALLMAHFGSEVLWAACGLFGLFSLYVFSQCKEPKVAAVLQPLELNRS
ncbi:MAG: MFS transporter [Gammaproteobacteria bacterium]|nr:MFS transporter [Gammaproteobacteria bacterium]